MGREVVGVTRGRRWARCAGSMSSMLRECRLTLGLAFPIIIGQVSQMLLGVTDSVMIGRLGAVPLAAASLVTGVFTVFFLVAVGLLLPVAVLVSRAYGAGKEEECAAWYRHGMAMGVGVGVGMMGLMGAAWWLMGRMGQEAEVVAVMGPYYGLVTVSLVPTLLFQVDRQFAESLGRAWAPMGIMLAGVGLNVFLNWVLIYGNLGAPALGLTGAGWATLIARVVSAGHLHWWLRVRAKGMERALPRRWRGRWEVGRWREMLVIGVPAGAMMLCETGAFLVSAVMIGWMGATALAAHQIALSCAAFMFMFPLGISMAVSMRVAKAVGEGRGEALRRIGLGALGVACLIMSTSAVGFAWGGEWLARGFVTDPEVIALAARLLVVAAFFQLFDGTQVVFIGALRGLADTRVPAMITFVAYWVLAIPVGYGLGVRLDYGATGVWVSLAGGLALAALLLGARFVVLTGPGRRLGR